MLSNKMALDAVVTPIVMGKVGVEFQTCKDETPGVPLPPPPNTCKK